MKIKIQNIIPNSFVFSILIVIAKRFVPNNVENAQIHIEIVHFAISFMNKMKMEFAQCHLKIKF